MTSQQSPAEMALQEAGLSSGSDQSSHDNIGHLSQRRLASEVPAFQHLYQDPEHARRWLDQRMDEGEPDYSQFYLDCRANLNIYAEQLYNCIFNLEELREKSSNAYKNFVTGKINSADVEAVAILLADAWINRHELGPLRRLTKISVADQNLEMNERFNRMCTSLTMDKLICEDVMKRGKLEEFVHGPEDSLKTKAQNQSINRSRADVYNAGNKALDVQSKRKPRRTTKLIHRRKMLPPAALALPMQASTNNLTMFDLKDITNSESFDLPPVSSILSQETYWPAESIGSHNFPSVQRAIRPSDLSVKPPTPSIDQSIDATLSLPPNTALMSQFITLEPDTHVAPHVKAPASGLSTSLSNGHGSYDKFSFTYSSTGITPVSSPGFDTQTPYAYLPPPPPPTLPTPPSPPPPPQEEDSHD